MYTKRRVNAAYNKTRVFSHRLTHALMGRHCSSKYEFPKDWMFEDTCIYENIVAIGQPTGWITLIDMNTQQMFLEISVYEDQIQNMREPQWFRWNEVLINGKYIIGASTKHNWNNKVYDYNGNLITDKLPSGRPLLWHGNKFINMSRGGFTVYDLDDIKKRIESKEEEFLIPELSFEKDDRHYNI